MAEYKIEIRPKTDDGTYPDIAYPKTTADMVVDESNGGNVQEHLNDNAIHVRPSDRVLWNGKADGNHEHSISDIDGLRSELDSKASTSIAVGEYRTSTLSVSISPGKIRKKSLFVGSDVVKVIVGGVGMVRDTFELYKGGDYGLRDGRIFSVNRGYANGGDFSNARKLGDINTLGVYLCDIYISGSYLRIDLGSEYDRNVNEKLKFLVYKS